MKTIKLITVALLFVSSSLFAQEDKKEFKPSGKPFAKIFLNYHNGIGNMNDVNGFELGRAYFGYEYNITKNLKGKVTFDVGNPKNGSKLENTAYVKNAYMAWKQGDLSVNFGLIGTKAFKTQEKFWGNRYLFKSFQDEYKWASSADMGISIDYKLAKTLSADFILVNGEGYKSLQSDNKYRMGLGMTFKPAEGLTLRGYYDNYSKPEDVENTDNQSIYAFFAGYKTKKFSLGAEYNILNNFKFEKDSNLTGISAYTSYKVCKNVKLYGRFDNLSSKDDWNKSKDGQLILAGVEYSPVKNLKISPNFRNWNPKEDGADGQSFMYMSVQLAF